MESIERLRPHTVIVAQSGGHASTDWPALTARVRALGAGSVIVVGPFPAWQPGLPRIYAEHHMQDHAEYVATGLDVGIFENDRACRPSVAGLANVTFVSLLDRLCHDVASRGAEGAKADRACLARVPGEGDLDLMSLDFGHLTPKGSSYLGRAMWKAYLDRIIQVDRADQILAMLSASCCIFKAI